MSLPAAGRVDAGPPDGPPIRLMIVDDSAVARAVLTRMTRADGGFDVVATAGDAGEALSLLDGTSVDVVLLDLDMPGASGIEALPEIVRRGRGARVLIVSSFCDGAAAAAVAKLGSGAADILAKPGTGQATGPFADVLADRLRRMAARPAAVAAAPARQPAAQEGLACLAVGASTGGLNAVCAMLRALPADLPTPILVTQHLPTVFIPFFARQVEAACGRKAAVAEDGAELRAGEVVLAPGDAHLSLERNGGRVRIRLDRESVASSGCLPSVDVMLSAVARVFGRQGLGVILSGMGRDGLEGARRMVASGATVLAQDRESSAVWGMPRAVAEAGLVAAVLPPAALADRIASHAEGLAWR